MGYRLTGPVIERLCVKHVRGRIRAVVTFSLDDVAWVLLVGEHLFDSEVNVYDELYRLVVIDLSRARSARSHHAATMQSRHRQMHSERTK